MTHAVKVESLGKEYVLGRDQRAGRSLLVEQLAGALRHPLAAFRRAAASRTAERFWALRDVTFEIQPGEVLGIVGRNGAGKSTLLKILSRITEPSAGRALVCGRLASLLEVGTGFHPELTGRENIYLNATILGMRRREIDRKFAEIVAFSGVERFLDTPVKHYSSGMYVRLAFAVAAHVEADVLLVDEVLAVGDAEFQKRCLGKMGQVSRSGKTVVLVSHALDSLARLCSRVLWLDLGQVRSIGDTGTVLKEYSALPAATSHIWRPEPALGRPIEVESVRVRSATQDADDLRADEPFVIAFKYRVTRPTTGRLALLLRDEMGTTVLASASTDGGPALNGTFPVGGYEAICTLPAHLLAPGGYTVSVAVPDDESAGTVAESVLSFEIPQSGSLMVRDGRRGVVAPLLDWRVTERP